MADVTMTDFAVAAYREDGAWQVNPLPLQAAEDLDDLVTALRRQPAEAGALGLVSVADDFFLALRVRGAQVQLLLSDATAADEWPLAQDALDALDLADEELADDAGPVGDFTLAADLGLSAMELSAICGDLDAYPDELLGRVAERLGFGELFDDAVDSAS